MRNVLIGLGLSLLAISALAQVSDGDTLWNSRADGAQGGHAKAAPIDAAIGAYRKAVASNPNDLEARWKLMRAIRFKGAYAASDEGQKKQIYDDAKSVGGQSVSVVERMIAAKGVGSPGKASERAVAAAAQGIPNAAEIYFWDSVNWGEWAVVYGKLAAVREGAADRIKRESTIALLADPKIDDGGPARVLGRLHNQTPRVPFITGWASDSEAVKFLRQSLAISPANKLTKVFLAEAMVSNDSGTRPQAIQLLKEVVSAPIDQNWAVEDADSQKQAQSLLRNWGAK
jgi:hypothetical protein